MGESYYRTYAFLRENATVLAEISIRDEAIIGVGSVVAKNVEPYTVGAGNPARVEDYVAKCERREVLFTPPGSFNRIFSGEKKCETAGKRFSRKI